MKGEEAMTYKRILVPVDGSRASNRGLREAIRLAKGQQASLQLVHVVDEHTVLVSAAEVGPEMVNLMLELRKRGSQLLRSAEALVQRNGLKCVAVLLEAQTGPAADLIVRQARKSGADLIVIGTHGRRGLRRLIMGSDAEQIVRTSPVPVMLVRERAA
jgi:nucleotide-binding universal stress UspA family protein